MQHLYLCYVSSCSLATPLSPFSSPYRCNDRAPKWHSGGVDEPAQLDDSLRDVASVVTTVVRTSLNHDFLLP